MNNKVIYSSEIQNRLPVFHKAFWLDVFGKSNWDVAIVEKDQKVVVSMPYFFQNSVFGLKIQMPFLTQFLGPYFHQKDIPIQEQHKLLDELLIKLPKYASCHQRCSPQLTNWLPYYWNGFQQSVRYTYQINYHQGLDSIWKSMQENRRRNIKKAEKIFLVQKENSISEVYQFIDATYSRKDMHSGFGDQELQKLLQACLDNQALEVFFAYKDGKKVGVVVMIHDSISAYYLMGGTLDEYLKTGVMSLLLWEAIKYFHKKVDCFDFEGSMNRGIESFFSSFGSVQTPYFDLNKVDSPYLRFYQNCKKLIR